MKTAGEGERRGEEAAERLMKECRDGRRRLQSRCWRVESSELQKLSKRRQFLFPFLPPFTNGTCFLPSPPLHLRSSGSVLSTKCLHARCTSQRKVTGSPPFLVLSASAESCSAQDDPPIRADRRYVVRKLLRPGLRHSKLDAHSHSSGAASRLMRRGKKRMGRTGSKAGEKVDEGLAVSSREQREAVD